MSIKIKCDQCEALAINGQATHERGCPNQHKTWILDSDEGLFLRPATKSEEEELNWQEEDQCPDQE